VRKPLRLEELPGDFIKNLPKIPKEGLANCLDCDTIIGNLAESRRLPGDSMRLCNGAGTKSFKKLCQERGIPPGERERLALARDDLGLVWIEGLGCAHRCRVTEKTRRVFQLTIDS
jgi:tRNA(Ile)-lysidine synthetase-like protein